MQALIPLALEGTDVGKVKAAHALAKIAAVSNPDTAFPGERVCVCVGGAGRWEGLLCSWGAWHREGKALEVRVLQASLSL